MHTRLALGIFCTESMRDSRCSTATVKPVAKYLYTFKFSKRRFVFRAHNGRECSPGPLITDFRPLEGATEQ
ncbi:hypothetical protein EVAR_76049_1 [Eumeta japonica]|uniref:Uncharacterized protein n=1 Tax=Eumeta variegata TaxID=151549 RepID=A0A4C1UAC3_EUMVA|nr:hypothetical protein EVAR_76049_1 [Eumeta japonica]